MLGKVRGTLDGTPLDKDFPRLPQQKAEVKIDSSGDNIGMFAYATEGWAISNRGWMSTLTFSNLSSTHIAFVDKKNKPVGKAKMSKDLYVELIAPLNINPDQPDQGWVELTAPDGSVSRLALTETANDSGVFKAIVPIISSGKWTISYGYWGFKKSANIVITK